MNKTFDIIENINVVEEPQFLIDFRTKPVITEKKKQKL